jgi:hypothetical protein
VDHRSPEFEHQENLFYQHNRNEFDFTNIHVWAEPSPDLSIATQDIATAISTTGAVVEASATSAGCTAAPGSGCVTGWSLGNGFYQVVLNPAETALSWFSTFLSISYDLVTGSTRSEGNVLIIGEASATALAASITGQSVPIGSVDAAIDSYASAYNHGNAPGIWNLLGVIGKAIAIGNITLQFGDLP